MMAMKKNRMIRYIYWDIRGWRRGEEKNSWSYGCILILVVFDINDMYMI